MGRTLAAPLYVRYSVVKDPVAFRLLLGTQTENVETSLDAADRGSAPHVHGLRAHLWCGAFRAA